MWIAILKLFGLGPLDYTATTRPFMGSGAVICRTAGELQSMIQEDGGQITRLNQRNFWTKSGQSQPEGQEWPYTLILTKNFLWFRFARYPTFHLGLDRNKISYGKHFEPKTGFFKFSNEPRVVHFSCSPQGNRWLVENL
jgi:hypothetical protein